MTKEKQILLSEKEAKIILDWVDALVGGFSFRDDEHDLIEKLDGFIEEDK